MTLIRILSDVGIRKPRTDTLLYITKGLYKYNTKLIPDLQRRWFDQKFIECSEACRSQDPPTKDQMVDKLLCQLGYFALFVKEVFLLILLHSEPRPETKNCFYYN